MPHRLARAIHVSSHRKIAYAALVAAVLMLSGCVTGDMGGYPQGGGSPGSSYPGSSYPDQPYPQQYPADQVIGTVQGVDVNAGRILLDARTSNYGGSSRVEVYFDQRTQLAYRGQVYPVNGLEPGDEIRVDTTRTGGRLWARSIELLRNVRDGQDGGDGQGGGHYNGGDLRGEVGYVDARTRTIELGRGAGGNYGAGQRFAMTNAPRSNTKVSATVLKTCNAATSYASRCGSQAMSWSPNASGWRLMSIAADPAVNVSG